LRSDIKKIKIKSNHADKNKKKESMVPKASFPGPLEHFAEHSRLLFPGFEKRPIAPLFLFITVPDFFERIVVEILLGVYLFYRTQSITPKT
jgi:hypothetical protein